MKKFILVLGVIFLMCNISFAQNKFRLTEGWEFIKGDLGGIWESVRNSKPGDPESAVLWQKVILPHCFNAADAVDPDVNYYEGPGWYRRKLDIQNPFPDGRTILHFEGAGQKTSVYVYTTLIGTHVGGYDEFSFDITDAVNEFKKTDVCKKDFKGKIPVSIRCDNTRDLEMIPSDLSDFNVYGGLYRYVNLEYYPSVALKKVFVNASVKNNGKTGIVDISAVLSAFTNISNGNVELKIYDPLKKVIAETKQNINAFEGEKKIWNLEIKKPFLWSPSDPLMYACEATLRSDAGEQKITEKFGFRYFDFVKKGPFILNGQRLLLKGTHRHEDHAGTGAAMTEEMIRAEMRLMKDMGVNFIRLGHYQQSGIVLNLCDSLGILVWEEIPWCRGGLGGDLYKAQARRMLTNMISQHRNHPAIIIWGLGNENDWPGDFPEFDKEKIRSFMKELNDLSHHLDSTRKTAIRRCDFCKNVVDVYSPSIWAGWYRGQYVEYMAESEKEMNKVDHFLHVEYGGDSHAGRHSEDPDKVLNNVKEGTGVDERSGDFALVGGSPRVSKDGDWSETYICNLFDWHLKEQENMPWLTGAAAWIFKDFSTPLRPENPIPYVNQKGVVERDLTKKEAYYVFQSYWTTKPMVHIYGHSWPVRWGKEGEDKMVKVYSNCREAELFLNGKSMGIKKRNSQDFPAAGLRWVVRFNKGENHIKVTARQGSEVVTDEIVQQYQTDTWGKPERMILEKTDMHGDTAIIQVKLVDIKNIQCLDAMNYVRFSIAGDGRLLENLGTSSGSKKVQVYNGRAIIRAIKNKGKSMIGVQSDGLPTEFIEL